MERPRAILFDLDDTIISHTVPGEDLWPELCRRYAPLLGGVDENKLYEVLSETLSWYWSDPERHRRGRLDLISARRELVGIAFSKLGIDNPDVVNKLADAYSEEREEAVSPFPGALETLEHFRGEGVKLALITNGSSDFQRKKIDRFELEQYFDVIIVEGEFGAGKPDEQVFLHALEKLGVAAGEAWMVGDNLTWDVSGAKKVGLYAVWVDWRGRGLPENPAAVPDRIVRNISELV